MNPALPATRKQKFLRETKDYLMIALGMIMYGIGWTVFLLPSDIPSGAVPGIASIIYWGTSSNQTQDTCTDYQRILHPHINKRHFYHLGCLPI